MRLFRFLLTALFGVMTATLILVVAAYAYIAPELPSIEVLRNVELQVPLRVFDRDQRLIAEFGEKRRTPVVIAEVPDLLIKAFLAAEDDRFFQHPGVDYQGLLRAGFELARTGEKRQGGSTITMQVARNFFLTSEKTYLRKVTEILLALKIERELSKNEILELYLNKIYLGQRAYGIAAAAQVYYGTTLDALTVAQMAMIAGLPKAPSRYNPITDSQRAVVRRNYVLDPDGPHADEVVGRAQAFEGGGDDRPDLRLERLVLLHRHVRDGTAHDDHLAGRVGLGRGRNRGPARIGVDGWSGLLGVGGRGRLNGICRRRGGSRGARWAGSEIGGSSSPAVRLEGGLGGGRRAGSSCGPFFRWRFRADGGIG